MKKQFYKYGLAGVLLVSFIVAFYFYLTENYLKFDRRYLNQIEKYEDIDSDLRKYNFSDFRNKYDSVYIFPNAGVSLDFAIVSDSNGYLKTKAPLIQKLFDQKLIESILILSNGQILYQLKWCDRPNCIDDQKGFFGFYTHYLSKDKIHFKNLRYTKLIDQKSFGEWTYYIVWSSKG